MGRCFGPRARRYLLVTVLMSDIESNKYLSLTVDLQKQSYGIICQSIAEKLVITG